MYCPCASTFWMRASTSALRTLYCAFRSVNSIRPYLPLQFFDFLLGRLVLGELAFQEARRGADLFPCPFRRQVVRVGELVAAVPEVLHLHQAAREQRPQTEIHLADAHAELVRELALRQLGVGFQQLQQSIAGLFV